jgi:hypothetical protein
MSSNYILASIPLLFPAWIAIDLLENPRTLALSWLEYLAPYSSSSEKSVEMPSVSSQLLIYSAMGIFGYLLTNRLVPNIKVRTVLAIVDPFRSGSDTNIAKREGCKTKTVVPFFISSLLESLHRFEMKTSLHLEIRHALHFSRNTHFEKEYAGKI